MSGILDRIQGSLFSVIGMVLVITAMMHWGESEHDGIIWTVAFSMMILGRTFVLEGKLTDLERKVRR